MARWLPRSLRARLSLLAGFIVAVALGTAATLQLRMFEHTLQTEIVRTARATARAVADDVELRARAGEEGDFLEVLHQFLEVNPTVRAISLLTGPAGSPRFVASTSSGEQRRALAAASRLLLSGQDLAELDGSILLVTEPYAGRDGQGWVVVTASTASVERVKTEGGTIALLVTLPAVVVVTLVLDLLARGLVHRRIEGLRNVMRRVTGGDLSARATVEQPDEIGAIAVGLNSMLAELESLSTTLQNRVHQATTELVTRNSEVEEMYKRIFDLREALGHAERLAAVGQAAANVAHQVGTPLNLISGYVQMLLAEGAVDTRTRRRLELIQRQIEQVTSAVRSLLDRARRPIPREAVAPSAMVARVLEVAQPRLERAGIAAAIHAPPDLPAIDADAVQLELALLNLVSNAVDAMPHGGRLDVTIAPREGGGVRIEVADSGPGIPDALVPSVFEPWVTTKPFGQGTGLGLAITRAVVGAHGGTIAVANGSEGGAVFRIELPAARLTPAAGAEQAV